MPTEPEPITLAQLVHRAVEVCDDGSRPSLTELLERFEDADQPVSALADVEQRLDEALGPVDFDEGDGALTMARAVIVYLAHRRDELAEAPRVLVRHLDLIPPGRHRRKRSYAGSSRSVATGG